MLRSQVTRRWFVLSAVGAASCSRSDSREGVRKAAQYLWAQQAEDGGWHSRAYGLLRSGQSLTPFVLDALLDQPDRPAGRWIAPSRSSNGTQTRKGRWE